MTDTDTFLETIEDENRTPLSRLGSSKSLYAATEGDIDTEPVLRAAADAEYAAWQTFEAWVDDEPHDGARRAFAAAASDERDHYETVTDLLEDDHDPEDAETPALHEYLREREDTVSRLGSLLGRILASDRSKSQTVGFFVGSADPRTAQVFRDFGDDLETQRETTLEALSTVCESEEDWNRAKEAATGAIEAAYGEYVETLEGLGANPKPVC
ncbi:rubrerythrin family protein [Saliphagus sp. GCM10025334]